MRVMRRRHLRILLIGLAVALLATAQCAAQITDRPSARDRTSNANVLSLLPADSVTEHRLESDGPPLAYIARAGTLALRDTTGKRIAAIYYTAYTLKGRPAGVRPVTFAFNGGPGAASAYLHLGLVGPQVVTFGTPPDGARAQLRPNPGSWLRFTDLVLIDPVGTGWSRAAVAKDADQFWNVRADAQALAKVIALYIARNRRGPSPKYILGESYGGFRAVKVARALRREQGIVVAGIVMVSPFLMGESHRYGDSSPLAAALQLPTIAAAELDRRGRFSAEALAAVERFAMTDYLLTLYGKPLEGEAAKGFYERLAAITGLPVPLVARRRGFVTAAYLQYPRDGGRWRVSAWDAAANLLGAVPAAPSRGMDPILAGYSRRLAGLFVGYAREQLAYKTDLTYRLLNDRIAGRWRWKGGRGYVGLIDASARGDLRELLALNPSLRLLIGHGRSDLITPYLASRYIIDHMPKGLASASRVHLETYRGGHMFYFHADARRAFTARARAFYRRSEP
jgi:carboxypeptidase C (cathepsin A)